MLLGLSILHQHFFHLRGLVHFSRKKIQVPTIEIYNGSINLLDHLDSFRDWVNIYVHCDAIICRVFLKTWTRKVRVWYKTLKPRAIGNLTKLSRAHPLLSKKEFSHYLSTFDGVDLEGEWVTKILLSWILHWKYLGIRLPWFTRNQCFPWWPPNWACLEQSGRKSPEVIVQSNDQNNSRTHQCGRLG